MLSEVIYHWSLQANWFGPVEVQEVKRWFKPKVCIVSGGEASCTAKICYFNEMVHIISKTAIHSNQALGNNKGGRQPSLSERLQAIK